MLLWNNERTHASRRIPAFDSCFPASTLYIIYFSIYFRTSVNKRQGLKRGYRSRMVFRHTCSSSSDAWRPKRREISPARPAMTCSNSTWGSWLKVVFIEGASPSKHMCDLLWLYHTYVRLTMTIFCHSNESRKKRRNFLSSQRKSFLKGKFREGLYFIKMSITAPFYDWFMFL